MRKHAVKRTAAIFSIFLACDETVLDALTGELVRVVQETLQPERVNVWLKEIPTMSRFQNHLLTFARLFWLGFLLFTWVYWIASMPRFFALVNAGRHPDGGESGAVQVSPGFFAAGAATWGLSVPAWAMLTHS